VGSIPLGVTRSTRLRRMRGQRRGGAIPRPGRTLLPSAGELQRRSNLSTSLLTQDHLHRLRPRRSTSASSLRSAAAPYHWPGVDRTSAASRSASPRSLFLRDVYSDANPCDRVIPRELVYSCKLTGGRCAIAGAAQRLYPVVAVTCCASHGEFVVLEDNLRVPRA